MKKLIIAVTWIVALTAAGVHYAPAAQTKALGQQLTNSARLTNSTQPAEYQDEEITDKRLRHRDPDL